MSGTREPLPRGRHGIDRGDIRAHQRARIVDGTIECVAERGYAATTVGHIVARARVSRETFYELFSDKETCYDASLDATVGSIFAAFNAAIADTSLSQAERLEHGVRGYFEGLAERPALTVCFILERPRRGAEVEAEANEEIQRQYHDLYGTDDQFAVQSYLALLDGTVRRYVAQGRIEELPGIVDELMPVVRRVLELDA